MNIGSCAPDQEATVNVLARNTALTQSKSKWTVERHHVSGTEAPSVSPLLFLEYSEVVVVLVGGGAVGGSGWGGRGLLSGALSVQERRNRSATSTRRREANR